VFDGKPIKTSLRDKIGGKSSKRGRRRGELEASRSMFRRMVLLRVCMIRDRLFGGVRRRSSTGFL